MAATALSGTSGRYRPAHRTGYCGRLARDHGASWPGLVSALLYAVRRLPGPPWQGAALSHCGGFGWPHRCGSPPQTGAGPERSAPSNAPERRCGTEGAQAGRTNRRRLDSRNHRGGGPRTLCLPPSLPASVPARATQDGERRIAAGMKGYQPENRRPGSRRKSGRPALGFPS